MSPPQRSDAPLTPIRGGRERQRSYTQRHVLLEIGAELQNGLLHIDLKRETPEELKPRKIAIATAKPAKVSKQIEAKAA